MTYPLLYLFFPFFFFLHSSFVYPFLLYSSNLFFYSIFINTKIVINSILWVLKVQNQQDLPVRLYHKFNVLIPQLPQVQSNLHDQYYRQGWPNHSWRTIIIIAIIMITTIMTTIIIIKDLHFLEMVPQIVFQYQAIQYNTTWMGILPIITTVIVSPVRPR